MYPHVNERLTGVLEREGLAALVATTPASIAYVTGFRSLSQATYATPHLAVFAPQGTALVVPAIELATIVHDAVDVDHVGAYGGFVASYAEPPGKAEARIRALDEARSATPPDALAAALAALGVTGGRVGLDESRVTAPLWERLAAGVAPATLVPAAGHFLEARRIKSPWELEALVGALRVAEEALNTVIQALKPAMTEREAATLYEGEVVRRGGVPYGVVVAMGERTGIPDPWPSDRPLRRGDLVRLDVGAVVKGYHAEVARMAVMTEPDPRQEQAHAAVQTGLEAAVDAIRPGVPASRVHAAAVEAARQAGLSSFRRYHVGHGIGLEPYERPKLAAGIETPLESGEVLRVETPHYEIGWAGLSVKDTVLVGHGGGRPLNRAARGLVVLD